MENLSKPFQLLNILYDTVQASRGAQMVTNLAPVWETRVQSLGWEDPLEEGIATHSSILPWRIPMDRGAWGPWGHKESDTTERLSTAQVGSSLSSIG